MDTPSSPPGMRVATPVDDPPPISVAIATFNRRALLTKLLEPLISDPAAREIVVVVDGCRDGSYEDLLRLAASDPKLRPVFTENRGRPLAQRLAVESCSSNVALVLDDDVIPSPSMATGHARHHASADNLVVVGYMPAPIAATRTAESFVVEMYQASYELLCNRWERGELDVLQELWGGNISMSRDAFLASTPPQGLRYHDDISRGLRLAAMGFTGRFDRSLSSTHLYARTYAEYKRDSRYMGMDLRVLAVEHPGEFPPHVVAERYGETRPVRRAVVQLAAQSRFRRLASWLLDAAVWVTGRVRIHFVERRLAELATTAERQRGFLDADAEACRSYR